VIGRSRKPSAEGIDGAMEQDNRLRVRRLPAERLAYERLRALTEKIVGRHATISQRALADAVGVGRTMISSVLKGRATSIPTLHAIARALMLMVSSKDQRRLHHALPRTVPIIGKPSANPRDRLRHSSQPRDGVRPLDGSDSGLQREEEAPKRTAMARGLTPTERLAYEDLRTATVEVIGRYPTAQSVLTERLGAWQRPISSVLSGHVISVATLQAIALALMSAISPEDQRALQDQLARVLPLFVRKR